MIRIFTKQLLSTTLSLLLVVATTPFEAGAQQPAQQGRRVFGTRSAAVGGRVATTAGPIALYPDALVAQILGAATFPDQVAAAATGFSRTASHRHGSDAGR